MWYFMLQYSKKSDGIKKTALPHVTINYKYLPPAYNTILHTAALIHKMADMNNFFLKKYASKYSTDDNTMLSPCHKIATCSLCGAYIRNAA